MLLGSTRPPDELHNIAAEFFTQAAAGNWALIASEAKQYGVTADDLSTATGISLSDAERAIAGLPPAAVSGGNVLSSLSPGVLAGLAGAAFLAWRFFLR